MIGDVIVEGGEEINLNRFLVQEGWAFPASYESTRSDEIRDLMALARAGIWQFFTQKPGKFNFQRVYRPGKQVSNPKPGEDSGPALFPTFYRRRTTSASVRSAGATQADFREYLKTNPDRFVTTATFLNGHPKASTLDAVYKNGAFQVEPEDLVFEEKPSMLIGIDPKPVQDWFTATAAA